MKIGAYTIKHGYRPRLFSCRLYVEVTLDEIATEKTGFGGLRLVLAAPFGLADH
jgi:hypothetical protein